MQPLNRLLRKFTFLVSILACLFIVRTSFAIAQPNFTEIPIHLGDESGQLQFFPNDIHLKLNQKYKLILDNPSPSKHYFTAKDFADASWTQKVQAGKVEIKGAIHDLELKPGGLAEWVLIPQKAGIYSLYCSVLGHREAGMIGKITIQ